MSQSTIESSVELNNDYIDQVIELVIQSAVQKIGQTNSGDENIKIDIDLSKIALDLIPFDAFRLCYEKLLDTVNQPDNQHNLIKSHLKLCLHDWDSRNHSCVISILVDSFLAYKHSTSLSSFSQFNSDKLNCFFDFLKNLRCLSQISKLIDLFNITTFTSEILLPYIEPLLADNCYYLHSAFIVNSLNIRQNVNSNSLLINLLFEDKFSAIDTYLHLNLKTICAKSLFPPIEDKFCDEYFISQFLMILDRIFTNQDLLDSLSLQDLKTSVKNNTISKKIYRYVLDLFKKPAFSKVTDHTLTLVCPNITKVYFNKQLSTLLYHFKKQPLSVSVITDHVLALMKLSNSALNQKAHHEILHLFIDKNDIESAKEYSRIFKLKFKESRYTDRINNNNSNKKTASDLSKYLYPFKLNLNNGIYLVDSNEKFLRCMNEIEKWKFLCLDCEWYNNYFVLRSFSRLSLIQVANNNCCYLIDCDILAKQTTKPLQFYLNQFIDRIINNDEIVKIGYSIDSDFRTIANNLNLLQKDDSTSNRCLLDVGRINTIDFRDLFNFLTNPANGYLDLFDKSRLQISTGALTGISQVTYLFVGYSIDKSEQVSDWLKRPLRNSQILYAALDAYCLVDCYNQLTELLQSKKNLSIQDFIADVFNVASSHSPVQNLRNKISGLTLNDQEANNNKKPMPMREFRCVVDTMLFGIVRYLRICCADVLTTNQIQDREEAVKLALKENRVFITSGHVYERYRKYFPTNDDCIHLSNSLAGFDQFKELVRTCRLVINLEDLFARCSLCNAIPFTTISSDEFRVYYDRFLEIHNQQKQSDQSDQVKLTEIETNKKIILENHSWNGKKIEIDFEQFIKIKFNHRFPTVDKFYICPNCGHIFWDGCHSSNFIQSIKSLIVDT